MMTPFYIYIYPVFLASQSQIDREAIKLGDFGLGYILKDNASPETYIGTPDYMPPVSYAHIQGILELTFYKEINRQTERGGVWTTLSDVFSFGCGFIYSSIPVDLKSSL